MGTVDLVNLGNDTIIIAGSGRQDQVLRFRTGIVVPFSCEGRT